MFPVQILLPTWIVNKMVVTCARLALAVLHQKLIAAKGTICSIPCIEDASVCFPIYPAILSGMFYGSLCPEVEAALQAEARLTLLIKIVGAHSVLSSNYFDPDGRLRTAC